MVSQQEENTCFTAHVLGSHSSRDTGVHKDINNGFVPFKISAESCWAAHEHNAGALELPIPMLMLLITGAIKCPIVHCETSLECQTAGQC